MFYFSCVVALPGYCFIHCTYTKVNPLLKTQLYVHLRETRILRMMDRFVKDKLVLA